MRLPFRQSRQLRGIERGLRRSAPQLAAMLATFSRLNAGDAILSREQVRQPGNWMRAVAGLLARAMITIVAVTRRLPGRAARGCVAAGRLIGRASLIPLGPRPGPRNTAGPRGALGL